MRIHSADVHQEASVPRNAVELAHPIPKARFVDDPESIVGRLGHYVDARPRELVNRLKIRRRRLGDGHGARCLQMSQRRLRAPEPLVHPSGEKKFRKTLGGRIVVAHDASLPLKQRKVGIERWKEEDVIGNGLGQPCHLQEIAGGPGRTADRRLVQPQVRACRKNGGARR